MSTFRVELDKKVGQSFGACVELSPQFFQLSDIEVKSTIEVSEKTTSGNIFVSEKMELNELNCIREAVESCLLNAIHIINLETEEKRIWPGGPHYVK